MFEGIKSFFRKESATGRVIFYGQNQAKWSKRDYETFSEEGYQKNVVAYQAINKIAQAVADIDWVLKSNTDESIESPLLELINNPNPLQSREEFLQAVVGFYKISGNSYIERVVASGQAKELYALRPDRMTVIPSNTGFPSGYKYKVGMESITWQADNGVSDIRHLKTFHPTDDWYGLAPIEAGAYGIDQHNEASKWLMSLLQNGGAPSGALKVDKETELTDDQYHRLKSDIDEKYTGAKNAGRPLLLEGGMDWQQMGLSPQNMSIIETKYSSARDISLALGVPPLLLNIQGDSTYSNYSEARLAFYEETVIPLAKHIVSEFNSWFKDELQGNKFDLDIDTIPAIVDKRMQLWSMVDQSSDLTINEKREIKGYEPVDGGDDIYITASLIPINLALEEPEQDPEQAGAEAYGEAEEAEDADELDDEGMADSDDSA